MAVDDKKLAFYSGYPTDKVFAYSTKTDSYPANFAGVNINANLPISPTYPNETTFVATLPNTYGKRGLVTLSWSLDGVNYFPQDTTLEYYNPTFATYMVQMVCAAGCDDNNVFILATTQYTAPQQVFFQIAVDSLT